MVERFAEAVLHDGVAVGSILTLTFTEKAAAELRERIRRRFGELGEAEHARAVDAAWIGTIHGFCARVLRSQPLAAGLDPRFAVLDEAAARRLGAARVRDRAGGVERRARRARRRPRRRLRARARADDRSRALRAAQPRRDAVRGWRCRRRRPRAGPARARRRGGRGRRRPARGAGNGARVTAALEALEACERLTAAAATRRCRARSTPPSSRPAPRRSSTTTAPRYREAWAAYRAACADHHARPVLVLLDALLGRFGTAYADAKAARAGVDFDDLELRVRDLLRRRRRRCARAGPSASR